MARQGNQLLGAILLAFVLLAFNLTAAFARTWTLSELDTLSDRKWLWVDEKYKESISESSNTRESVTELPRKSRGPKPDYPRAALAGAKEGSVWMKVFIDEKGLVRAAYVLEDTGLRVGFEEAALEAAIRTQWRPAYRDRDRVAVWVKYEVAYYARTNKWEEPIRLVEPWYWIVAAEDPVSYDDLTSARRQYEIPSPNDSVGFEKPPKPKKQGVPKYPPHAQSLGIEGSVWVQILLSKSGRVARAKIAKDSGLNCGFEEAALWAAVDSEWTPARQGGEPINLWVIYEVRFQFQRH